MKGAEISMSLRRAIFDSEDDLVNLFTVTARKLRETTKCWKVDWFDDYFCYDNIMLKQFITFSETRSQWDTIYCRTTSYRIEISRKTFYSVELQIADDISFFWDFFLQLFLYLNPGSSFLWLHSFIKILSSPSVMLFYSLDGACHFSFFLYRPTRYISQ
jgi:hypothetical protein